ncbi:MAG: hypothetical protein A3F68_08500 [Acidobacteria bacterium RIFCSPLOWO2_12_FULL_54_10]|nr:MAG: hypothetical protein A3F68_08500 [Acidobacteria bacterium RIFCSPLOWO2_12_FULL_54_10]
MSRICRRLSYVFVGLSLALALSAGTWAEQPISPKAQQRLEREVRHELIMLPFYGVFDHLAFQVSGYDVVLTGQVTRPTLRSDAEQVVKRVEGVEQVTNNVEVLPLSPHDDRIRRAVYRAIYSETALQRYALQAVPPIHIIVNGGHVTLEGVVSNAAEMHLANMQAQQVAGVFSVTRSCFKTWYKPLILL